MVNHSGITNVRLGTGLHAHLAKLAESQDISLNHLIVTLLAGGSNFTLAEDDESIPPVFIWGSDGHVDQVMERLGRFESRHIQLELQVSKNAAEKRIRAAKRAGVLEVEREGRGAVTAIYRWVGPRR